MLTGTKTGIVVSAFKSTVVLFYAFFLWLAFFDGLECFLSFISRVSAFFFQNMPSLSEEEQITMGDGWAHYMEVEIKDKDLSLRVDHFRRNVFGGIDSSGDKFVVLPKMVKCALALCHSNTDVGSSLSVNKKMLTKMNITINSLRSTKAAAQNIVMQAKCQ